MSSRVKDSPPFFIGVETAEDTTALVFGHCLANDAAKVVEAKRRCPLPHAQAYQLHCGARALRKKTCRRRKGQLRTYRHVGTVGVGVVVGAVWWRGCGPFAFEPQCQA